MTIRYRVVDRLWGFGRWCGNLLGSAGPGERGIFSPYILAFSRCCRADSLEELNRRAAENKCGTMHKAIRFSGKSSAGASCSLLGRSTVRKLFPSTALVRSTYNDAKGTSTTGCEILGEELLGTSFAYGGQTSQPCSIF